MKTRLFINPVSGSDMAPDYLPLINERLRQRVGEMDIVMTIAAGDATRGATQAVIDGYDHIVVAGGDGTLNEVINGVGSVANGFANTTFGVIPLGTGNDFATVLGMPADIAAALDALDTGTPRLLDVGVVNGHHFINVSGGGFIAEVSDAVDTELKSLAGKLAYLIGGAQVLLTHETVRTRISTPTPGVPSELELHAFAVCNSRQIGGGRLIAPDAVLDDGLLDVCLIEAMPTLEFVALLRRVSDGDHVDDERVRYFRASSLDLDFPRPLKINTDGQVLEARRCEYRVLPQTIRFLVPPQH